MKFWLQIGLRFEPIWYFMARPQKLNILGDFFIFVKNMHLVVKIRGGGLQSVSDLNPSAMPLHFTLLFPYGTKGWDMETTHANSRRRVTPREFFAYHTQLGTPQGK